MLKKYVMNVLVSISQMANALLGGDPDETLSSRMGKKLRTSLVAYWVCRFLSLFDKRHCERAVEADEGKDAVVK